MRQSKIAPYLVRMYQFTNVPIIKCSSIISRQYVHFCRQNKYSPSPPFLWPTWLRLRLGLRRRGRGAGGGGGQQEEGEDHDEVLHVDEAIGFVRDTRHFLYGHGTERETDYGTTAKAGQHCWSRKWYCSLAGRREGGTCKHTLTRYYFEWRGGKEEGGRKKGGRKGALLAIG